MSNKNIVFPPDPDEMPPKKKTEEVTENDKTLEVASFHNTDPYSDTSELSISEMDKTVAETHIDLMNTRYHHADDLNEETQDTDTYEIPAEPPKRKKKKHRKKSRRKEIRNIIIFLLLTVVFLFDGINIAGLLMNGSSNTDTSGSTTATSTPTATATIEATAEATSTAASTLGDAIGSVQVGDTDIYLRSDTDVSSDMTGTAAAGAIYSVYDIVEANGYTWYELDENAWMPDDGTWAVYTAY